jgi:sigma-B regulation protein RsbU (phosphoserine phosphatase)
MSRSVIQSHIASSTKTLIIDDSDLTRQLLKKWCINYGFTQLQEAQDGVEGLQMAIDWQPHLIFLDVNMPNMDGMTMLRELQRHHLTDEKVIMMQTVLDDVASKSKAFEYGITDFITKPLHQKEVMSRTMAHVERHYLQRTRLREALRHKEELTQAGTLQHLLMPQESTLKQLRAELDIDIAYYYKPADLISGDYCTVRPLEQGKVAIATADVAGHGVGSALYTFSLHAMLDYGIREQNNTASLLSYLNRELATHFPKGKFASMFMGIIDVQQAELYYSAAACPSPLLLHNREISWLESQGYLLGSTPHAEYNEHKIEWNSGDILFLYSDALVEGIGDIHQAMPKNYIAELIMEHQQRSSREIVEALTTEYFMHFNSNPQDDLTLMVCKF